MLIWGIGGQTTEHQGLLGGGCRSLASMGEGGALWNPAILSPLARVQQGTNGLPLLDLSVHSNLCCPLGELAQERRLLSEGTQVSLSWKAPLH